MRCREALQMSSSQYPEFVSGYGRAIDKHLDHEFVQPCFAPHTTTPVAERAANFHVNTASIGS